MMSSIIDTSLDLLIRLLQSLYVKCFPRCSNDVSRLTMHVITNVFKIYSVYVQIYTMSTVIPRSFHLSTVLPSVPPTVDDVPLRILVHTPLVSCYT